MRRARLLVPVAAAVLTLAACTAAPDTPDGPGGPGAAGGSPGGGSASASGTPSPSGSPTTESGDPEISVEAAGGAWVVRGTGFSGGNQYLVQCTGGTAVGSSALDGCDMSTSEQVVADGRGRISATRQVRAFVNVGSVTEVDCTDDPCALAVADLSDRVVAVAAAPLPGGSTPPDAPSLELSERKLDADSGRVTVAGEGFPAGSAVRIVQCATGGEGGVDGDSCRYDEGKRLVADRSGTVMARLPVVREIQLAGGDVVDCADAGACVIANAWTDGGRMARADLLWE